MRPRNVERVEGAPPFLLGLSLVRGEALPVVDAGVLLSGEPSLPTRFVTLRVDDRRVVLAVTEVLGTAAIATGNWGGIPPLFAGSSDVLRALGTLDGRLLEVLESARLVEAALTGRAAGAP